MRPEFPTADPNSEFRMARPEGLEPPTYGFEARRSIQLSYGRTVEDSYHRRPTLRRRSRATPRADPPRRPEQRARTHATRQPIVRPSASSPTEARHPHCVQSGSPPYWHGVIARFRSDDTHAVVCAKMHSSGEAGGLR